MTELQPITKAPGNVSRLADDDGVLDGHVLAPVRDPRERAWRVMQDYLCDVLTPALNLMRAYYGIEPAPPRPGPPITPEQAKAAADEYWALEALRAEQRDVDFSLPCFVITRPSRQPSDTTRTALGLDVAKPRRQPRRLPLDSLLKQAAKAGKSVKGAEVYQDRTVLQFGAPESATPENPWRLDEFRKKETKQ